MVFLVKCISNINSNEIKINREMDLCVVVCVCLCLCCFKLKDIIIDVLSVIEVKKVVISILKLLVNFIVVMVFLFS